LGAGGVGLDGAAFAEEVAGVDEVLVGGGLSLRVKAL
jgi:hypothetical protein